MPGVAAAGVREAAAAHDRRVRQERHARRRQPTVLRLQDRDPPGGVAVQGIDLEAAPVVGERRRDVAGLLVDLRQRQQRFGLMGIEVELLLEKGHAPLLAVAELDDRDDRRRGREERARGRRHLTLGARLRDRRVRRAQAARGSYGDLPQSGHVATPASMSAPHCRHIMRPPPPLARVIHESS
ncbi:MAG: hypothetical protein IPK07_19745 [Deltaproteobacteria bacterium]|nr:hypothetical protein [Deltaproteobacteria bacterium]